jgi:hypothetical protein
VGNIYLPDLNGCTIRVVVKSTGIWNGRSVTADYAYWFAGTGACGILASTSINTNARAIALPQSYGIAVDNSDNVYFNVAGLIFKVSGGLYNSASAGSGVMTTYFGTAVTDNPSCPTSSTTSSLSLAYAIAIDSCNNLYISFIGCYKVFVIYSGSTVATHVLGTGTFGSSSSSGTLVGTSTPMNPNYALAVDENGNLLYNDFQRGYVKMLRKSDSKTYLLAAITNIAQIVAAIS